ncbi:MULTISPECIES: CU044_2847 family protein [unclassified Streptomyces]|uniref:CU044_2847 family protein n=1 Tax=unclassified Streptomyces TaxID=2593676 RepID=UPI00278C6DE3|nr:MULTISPECIES: CU044_2847 family protein [unclassified Streptomyces]
MSQAVRFELADGTTVLVSPAPEDGVRKVGLGTHVANAQNSLRTSLAPVTRAAAEVIAEFRAGALRPEEIEVTFGVTLDARLGAIISSAKASAHLDVRLRWNGGRPADEGSTGHPSPATPPPPDAAPAPSPPPGP